MSKTEQRLQALEFFKDWSNYLLITTVAALGWLSTGNGHSNPCLRAFSIWCFAASTFFAILTLAVIPDIAEKIGEGVSIFETEATLPVPLQRPWLPPFFTDRRPKLRHFCFLQHALFLLGIALYAIAVTFESVK
jgi:hypothetical protein